MSVFYKRLLPDGTYKTLMKKEVFDKAVKAANKTRRIGMNQETDDMIDGIAKVLNCTKAEVIVKGVRLMDLLLSEVEKNDTSNSDNV